VEIVAEAAAILGPARRGPLRRPHRKERSERQQDRRHQSWAPPGARSLHAAYGRESGTKKRPQPALPSDRAKFRDHWRPTRHLSAGASRGIGVAQHFGEPATRLLFTFPKTQPPRRSSCRGFFDGAWRPTADTGIRRPASLASDVGRKVTRTAPGDERHRKRDRNGCTASLGRLQRRRRCREQFKELSVKSLDERRYPHICPTYVSCTGKPHDVWAKSLLRGHRVQSSRTLQRQQGHHRGFPPRLECPRRVTSSAQPLP